MHQPLLDPQQTLRELFASNNADTAAPTLTLAAFARRLGCSPTSVLPFIREGWLERADGLPAHARLSTDTLLYGLPAIAYTWLHNWVLPARAKPLFSRSDAAELLGLSEKEVVALAVRLALPVTHEVALGGLVFSAWAVKRMMLAQAGVGVEGRLDRQAMLHAILEADPERALQPPTFEKRLEQEIARVATLEEPARGIRAAELLAQWRDAKIVAQAEASLPAALTEPCVSPESSELLPPVSPSSESKASSSAARIEACEPILATLRGCV